MTDLRLSVVVVGYNMARELPRTIQTLGPAYQREISEDDYEVIVVDNGSTEPWEPEDLLRFGSNITVLEVADATSSPVRAINDGIAAARGELIGVFIDGARMASPRLLATALEARRLHDRPVIGTIAFHLGPDVQSRSIPLGYDREVEDALLDSVPWETDGYRLFDISALAHSSALGWFSLPAETNALFLTREHWQELGGYAPEFRAPGGGLVNLDTWFRACEDPAGQAILLLGEATFHQVHGGVATNSSVDTWTGFHDEYVAIRGHDYVRPTVSPLIFGRVTTASIGTEVVASEVQ